MPFKDTLKIGLIQTTLNPDLAWPDGDSSLKITRLEEIKAWKEIKKGFINLKNHSSQPHIIILPELSIPIGHIEDLKRIAKKMSSVIIGGVDFIKDEKGHLVSNRAITLIPHNWPDVSFSNTINHFYFGKTFFSKLEKETFAKCIPPSKELSDPSMYILDAHEYGKIGIAICSDFFDIERFVIYKGQIHHMIVISHNIDVTSYYFLAEAISRLVFCNVVICNTGYYGGSIAFSPYEKHFKRTIYKHEGKELFTTQIIEVPVRSLNDAQKLGSTDKIFKSQPPGYKQKIKDRGVRNIDF